MEPKSSFPIHVDDSFSEFMDIKAGWVFVYCTLNSHLDVAGFASKPCCSAQESELVAVCEAFQFVKENDLTRGIIYTECKFFALAFHGDNAFWLRWIV